MSELECAKAIACHLGIVGKRGGWLYSAAGKPVFQGWFHATAAWKRKRWIHNRSGQWHVDWRLVA